jgi:hypothetical protein
MKKVPQRKCVGCRQMNDKTALIRIGKNEDGKGRGAYVCNNRACIEQAKKNKGIERSLKQAVLPELYEKLLENPKLCLGVNERL